MKKESVEINMIQLFVLLQDTVTHIKMGHHLAPNYHYMKEKVLSLFGYNKNSTSKKLLVCIGHLYINEFKEPATFENYIKKHGLVDVYNKELDRLAQD